MTSALARNATANVLQMLFTAGAVFLLYRFVNATLGVAQLGVWSVVLASASLSRIADLGMSAGITRFVARDLAADQPDRAIRVVETGTLSLMAVLGVVLPASYPVLTWVLSGIFDAADYAAAKVVLPFALLSLWFSMTASIIHSGLDGCQRMDRRAMVVVAAQITMVMAAFMLVPAWGLTGLAVAYVGQGAIAAIGGWILLGRLLPRLSVLPVRWDRSVFREMLGYGANVQLATLALFLFDPITKALMAKFGGSSAAGYFEMANQVVLRARGFIVAANQAIVPRVSQLSAASPERLASLYRDNLGILTLVTLPVFALLFAWAPAFSLLLLDQHRPEFIELYQACAFAWFVNTFATPAYHMNLGLGSVGLNTLSHVGMGLINASLGISLGMRFGAAGVVVAYAVALAVGSLFLVVRFHVRNRIEWRQMPVEGNLQLLGVSILVGTSGMLPPLFDQAGIGMANLAVYAIGPMVLLVATWLHPMRKLIMNNMRRDADADARE